MAGAFLSQLRSEFLFLLFEVVELHLDQFVVFQRVIQGGEELWAEALLADFQLGLERMGRARERKLAEEQLSQRINYAGAAS